MSVTYMGYRDLATGKTLQVEPGGIYDIGPELPPENFVLFTEKKQKKTEVLPISLPAEESAPEVKENNV